MHFACICSAGEAISLVSPNGLAIDDAGRLYVSDIETHQIVRVEGDGALTVIAGTGARGYGGDGGVAINARLNAPHDLAFGPDRNLYVADTSNQRIRRIDTRGLITTVAGNGTASYSGDGGRAANASFNSPQDIVFDRGGNLYIADSFNHAVRKVDRDGIISTFAGTEGGFAGDDGPAKSAQLSLPMALAVGPDESLWISDSGNSRLRRIGADGMIRTMSGFALGAGTGGAGFSGDGGPLQQAMVFAPLGLCFGPGGQLFISDSGNNRIRVVQFGMIQTIAGDGTVGIGGDGQRGVLARLNTPQKLVVDRAGQVFVADRANHRVRMIDTDGLIQTVAGGGVSEKAGPLGDTD
jgi:sugar lactone lactonase YvrE